jgi:putative endonuclease
MKSKGDEFFYMSKTTKQFGDEGEEIAVELLKEKGYEIIERNYRYGKGEIDIIAKDPETNFTVFVEVKSRKNLEFGDPVYAVTKNKIKQIKRMAELYLYDKEIDEIDCRFDVITVLLRGKQKPVIEHYVNAFT